MDLAASFILQYVKNSWSVSKGVNCFQWAKSQERAL